MFRMTRQEPEQLSFKNHDLYYVESKTPGISFHSQLSGLQTESDFKVVLAIKFKNGVTITEPHNFNYFIAEHDGGGE